MSDYAFDRVREFDTVSQQWKPLNTTQYLPEKGKANLAILDGEMYVVSKRNSYVYRERETPVWRPLVTEGRDEESDLFFAFSFKYHELS